MSKAAAWLAHYDPGVPPTLEPYPDRTLVDYVAAVAREAPDSPALLFKGATVSYGRLNALSDACAAAFAALGIKRGDRVGLLLPNCPQFFIAQFGAWKLGAIVAPLNPIYTEHELEGPLRDHGVDTVVTLTRFYQRVKNIQARTGVRRVIATNIKEYFPPLLRVLFTLFREAKDGDRITLRPGDHDFAHLLLVNRGRTANAALPVPADPAVLLMSGGTTGTPKGVLGTHGAYVMAGQQVRTWNATAVGGASDVIFLPLPMFHVYGNAGVQSLTFMSGAAPEKQMRIDLKSIFPFCTSGWLSIAMYSVGTPLKNVGLTRLTVASRSARSRGFGTIAIAAPTMTVSACAPTLP